MKNTKLRIAWGLPYIVMVAANLLFIIYTCLMWNDLVSVNREGIFIIFGFLFTLVNIYGGFKIVGWIKQRKI